LCAQVFLLLVKRLASLHCGGDSKNNNNNISPNNTQKQSAISNFLERDKNLDNISKSSAYVSSIDEHDKKKLTRAFEKYQHHINDTITGTEKIMGSNVTSLSGNKGLSGRRTQSQSKCSHILYFMA
jgi:hypothetical protein